MPSGTSTHGFTGSFMRTVLVLLPPSGSAVTVHTNVWPGLTSRGSFRDVAGLRKQLRDLGVPAVVGRRFVIHGRFP
ncbi:MAG: hypothetical protein IRZ07_13340 [Microbispora sp.]|nr:hypothetical protein [Microbispora sp.]